MMELHTQVMEGHTHSRSTGAWQWASVVAIGLLLVFADLRLALGAVLEEIVVTARRQQENLQSVPVSITALSGESLEKLGVEDISGVAKFTPNLQFDNTAAISGSSIASTVFIRGVGQTDFTLNADPGVGIYVDGVYVARSVGGLLDLNNIERVEVLRGPQGTLFGKNTIGGAINVTTVRPAAEPGGYIEVQAGDFSRRDLKAGFDLPITDTLLTNVAAAFLNRDGYQERILQPDEEELGNVSRTILRGRATWTPTERFSADFIVDYTQGDEESMPQSVLRIEPDTSVPSLGIRGAPFVAAAAGVIPGTTPTIRPQFAGLGFSNTAILDGSFITDDPFRTFYGGISRSDFEITGVSAILTWDFGPAELKSITGFRNVESDFARDSLSSPFLVADTVDTWDHEQTSQEFQVSGVLFGDRVDYVAGLFYMDEEGTNDNLVDTSIGDLGSGGSIDNTVWALFGQSNLFITDSLVATLGVRYTDEEKEFTPGFRGGDQLFFTDANGLALPLPPTVPLIIPGTYEREDDSTDFTLALEYNFTEELMTYVSFTTGFKSGGFSQRIGPGPGVPAPEFRPEEVETAEVGFKWQGFDDALRLNAAVFFSDYSDLQVAPIFEGIGPVTRNIGDAEIRGAELEWSYAPTDALTLSGGVGYLDDEVTSLTPEATTNVALDGSQVITLDTELAKTPEFSANAEVAYVFAVGANGEIGARVNWSYTDELFNDVLNTPELERDSLHLLGLRLSYEHVDSGWILAVQGNNLTDEEYIVAGNAEIAGGQFGYIQGTFARPREWWASVRKDF